jgi:integrase/recombinase XerD
MADIYQLLTLHLMALRYAGKAHGTLDARQRRVTRFLDFIHGEAHRIAPDDILAFLAALPVSDVTRAAYWREIKAWWNWAAAEAYLPPPPHRFHPRFRPARSRLYPDQPALLALLDRLPCTVLPDKRWRCLFHTIYWTGARVSEALHLKLSDISLQHRLIRIYGEKTNRERQVPIPRPLAAELLRWMGHVRGVWLFPRLDTPIDAPVGRTSAAHQWADFQRALHVPDHERLRIHDLRHCHGRHARRAGMDLLDIRDVLGHADVKTTELYTRIDSGSILERMERCGFAC